MPRPLMYGLTMEDHVGADSTPSVVSSDRIVLFAIMMGAGMYFLQHTTYTLPFRAPLGPAFSMTVQTADRRICMGSGL